MSGSEETVLLRLSLGSKRGLVAWFEASVVGQGQSTTILLITLEVANSKAKSEGIQIYCYK